MSEKNNYKKYVQPLRNAWGLDSSLIDKKQTRLLESLLRKTHVPYIGLDIQLHGCVKDPEELIQDLHQWLKNKLNPDYESDIQVEISESSGWTKDKNFEKSK